MWIESMTYMISSNPKVLCSLILVQSFAQNLSLDFWALSAKCSWLDYWSLQPNLCPCLLLSYPSHKQTFSLFTPAFSHLRLVLIFLLTWLWPPCLHLYPTMAHIPKWQLSDMSQINFYNDDWFYITLTDSFFFRKQRWTFQSLIYLE